VGVSELAWEVKGEVECTRRRDRRYGVEGSAVAAAFTHSTSQCASSHDPFGRARPVDYARGVIRFAYGRVPLTLTLATLFAVGSSTGCGGNSQFHTDRGGGVANGGAGSPPDAGVPQEPEATASPPPRRPPPEILAPPGTVPPVMMEEPPFVDPGCPLVAPPVEDRQCDPLGVETGCEVGFGCFPYVEYPADPCAPEVFGTRCRIQGSGTQGADCSEGGCAEGFLCVATGQGTQCAQLCRFPGVGQCEPGLICGSVDIQGYGVCI
jgi:hypothetical protein